MADILGTFEQAVLLAVVRLGEGAYGRAILKALQLGLERNVAARCCAGDARTTRAQGLPVLANWGVERPSVPVVQDAFTVFSHPASGPE